MDFDALDVPRDDSGSFQRPPPSHRPTSLLRTQPQAPTVRSILAAGRRANTTRLGDDDPSSAVPPKERGAEEGEEDGAMPQQPAPRGRGLIVSARVQRHGNDTPTTNVDANAPPHSNSNSNADVDADVDADAAESDGQVAVAAPAAGVPTAGVEVDVAPSQPGVGPEDGAAQDSPTLEELAASDAFAPGEASHGGSAEAVDGKQRRQSPQWQVIQPEDGAVAGDGGEEGPKPSSRPKLIAKAKVVHRNEHGHGAVHGNRDRGHSHHHGRHHSRHHRRHKHGHTHRSDRHRHRGHSRDRDRDRDGDRGRDGDQQDYAHRNGAHAATTPTGGNIPPPPQAPAHVGAMAEPSHYDLGTLASVSQQLPVQAKALSTGELQQALCALAERVSVLRDALAGDEEVRLILCKNVSRTHARSPCVWA